MMRKYLFALAAVGHIDTNCILHTDSPVAVGSPTWYREHERALAKYVEDAAAKNHDPAVVSALRAKAAAYRRSVKSDEETTSALDPA
jgi:hypothetical protein